MGYLADAPCFPLTRLAFLTRYSQEALQFDNKRILMMVGIGNNGMPRVRQRHSLSAPALPTDYDSTTPITTHALTTVKRHKKKRLISWGESTSSNGSTSMRLFNHQQTSEPIAQSKSCCGRSGLGQPYEWESYYSQGLPLFLGRSFGP